MTTFPPSRKIEKAPIPVSQTDMLLCIECVAQAAIYKGPEDGRPPVYSARVIVSGNSLCLGHTRIEKQSPLIVPGRQG